MGKKTIFNGLSVDPKALQLLLQGQPTKKPQKKIPVLRHCYIETPGSQFKAAYLVARYGGQHVQEADALAYWAMAQSHDFCLVCVVENAGFDAAMVILLQADFDDAQYDPRPRTWLTLARSTVRALVPEEFRQELLLQ